MKREHTPQPWVEALDALSLAVWLGYLVRDVVHPLELERRAGAAGR